MDKLIEELRLKLMENPDVVVVNDQVWKLPIVLYDVGFDRVKRLKMDILMKMLLLAFQEADIRRAATLSDMLFVEELFISDLIEKMQGTGLIQLQKLGYKLTAKGYDYLDKGIFEEEMEGETTVIAFSAVHDEYRLVADHAYIEAEDKLPLYRYPVKGNLNKAPMQQLLSKEPAFSEEDGFQVIVTGITSCIEQATEFIPCIEFQLYDRQQDIFYARVWNGMIGSWDAKLEKQIEAREIVKWRENANLLPK